MKLAHESEIEREMRECEVTGGGKDGNIAR